MHPAFKDSHPISIKSGTPASEASDTEYHMITKTDTGGLKINRCTCSMGRFDVTCPEFGNMSSWRLCFCATAEDFGSPKLALTSLHVESISIGL